MGGGRKGSGTTWPDESFQCVVDLPLGQQVESSGRYQASSTVMVPGEMAFTESSVGRTSAG